MADDQESPESNLRSPYNVAAKSNVLSQLALSLNRHNNAGLQRWRCWRQCRHEILYAVDTSEEFDVVFERQHPPHDAAHARRRPTSKVAVRLTPLSDVFVEVIGAITNGDETPRTAKRLVSRAFPTLDIGQRVTEGFFNDILKHIVLNVNLCNGVLDDIP